MNSTTSLEMIQNTSSLKDFNRIIRKYECNLCPLREEAWVRNDHTYPIPNDIDEDYNDKQIDLVVVGGALAQGEGARKQTFSCPSGDFIRGAIESELSDSSLSYSFVNVCMCYPEDGRTPHVAEAKACYPFLQKQLSLMNPNAILSAGSVATRHLLGLTSNPKMANYIGKRFDVSLLNIRNTVPVIATYHPSYLYRKLQDGFLPIELEEHYINVIKRIIKLARRYKQ